MGALMIGIWVLRLDNHWTFEKNPDQFKVVVATTRREAEQKAHQFYTDYYGFSFPERHRNFPKGCASIKVYSLLGFVHWLIRVKHYDNFPNPL